MTDVVLFADTDQRTPLTIPASAGTYYSKIFGGNDCPNWSTHLVWTSTVNGTLTLWASNKPNPSEADDADWVQVTLPAGMAGPSGAGAGSNFCDVGNSGGRAYRLKFVRSANSGTLIGWAHGKQAA